MPDSLAVIFWVSAAGIGYTYAGYPALLWIFGRLFPRPVRKGPYMPRVSLLIAAHNEGKTIRRKLESCLELDYPSDRLEILVGTDGCTDETDAVVAQMKRQAPSLRHFRMSDRVGKAAVLNRLVSMAQGKILVFTDARQSVAPAAIRHLVENFRDPAVGVASGELILAGDGEGSVGKELGLYWRYEKSIRRLESRIGSTVGATGALYAIRAHLYRVLNPETILDDVEIPLGAVSQRFRTVFEPAALAHDQMVQSGREEFRRKVRTLAGNYQVFVRYHRLLIPGSPIAWQFWSHKVFRTLVPFWLLAAFLTSALLPHPIYKAAWAAQILFYGMAAAGWLAQRLYRKPIWGVVRLAYVFCLLNVSAVVGLYRFLRGEQPAKWEKARA